MIVSSLAGRRLGGDGGWTSRGGSGSGGKFDWRGGGSYAKENYVNEWGVVSMSADGWRFIEEDHHSSHGLQPIST